MIFALSPHYDGSGYYSEAGLSGSRKANFSIGCLIKAKSSK
jgi:hypothetical protein